MGQRFFVETLGCPKNQVDSDKLVGTLLADGMEPTDDASQADLVVVNTCAFIEQARTESIDTILALTDRRKPGARLVVTGCMAERYGAELAEALPEVDQVAGFGVSVNAVTSNPAPSNPATSNPATSNPAASNFAASPGRRKLIPVTSAPVSPIRVPEFDLLNLPRPKSAAPWAYVKIAEGCDRSCGFCAIPSFRGPQRSRTVDAILAEVAELDVREVVLVAQDLASYGRDKTGDGQFGGETTVASTGVGTRSQPIVDLVNRVAAVVDRTRLLYLYPSDLTNELIDAICATGVPYFDLSLQHVSKPLLRRMRRWGDGERFARRIDDIRRREPEAAFRSNFIVGYPGETEADHDQLLAFVESAELDWCGFFEYSSEEGTHAATLGGVVPVALMGERIAELREMQDEITARRRDALIGAELRVLVDEPGVARSTREAPEIDGVIEVPANMTVGEFADVVVTDALGPDLIAVPAAMRVPA